MRSSKTRTWSLGYHLNILLDIPRDMYPFSVFGLAVVFLSVGNCHAGGCGRDVFVKIQTMNTETNGHQDIQRCNEGWDLGRDGNSSWVPELVPRLIFWWRPTEFLTGCRNSQSNKRKSLCRCVYFFFWKFLVNELCPPPSPLGEKIWIIRKFCKKFWTLNDHF